MAKIDFLEHAHLTVFKSLALEQCWTILKGDNDETSLSLSEKAERVLAAREHFYNLDKGRPGRAHSLDTCWYPCRECIVWFYDTSAGASECDCSAK